MHLLPRATCPICGRSALQGRGQHQLFDPVSGPVLAFCDENQRIEHRPAYLVHECREEDIESFQQRVDDVISQLLALRENPGHCWDQADYVDARTIAEGTLAEITALIASHSLDRVCPKCDVQPGQPCENLTERRRGSVVPTKSAHAERHPPVDTVAGREIAALREQLPGEQGLVHDIYQALTGDEAIEKLITLARSHRI
jgi:hypothetical protein